MPFYLFDFRTRAIVNYVIILLLLLINISFSLSSVALFYTKILGIFLLVLTLITNFKYGLINIFSMKTIQVIEFILTIVLISIPLFLIDELEVIDIVFFCSSGAILVIINSFTDCENSENKHTLI